MGLFSRKNAITPSFVKIPTGKQVKAIFHTSKGQFTCELYPEQCPKTVGNFVGLATGQSPWINPKTGEKQEGPLYSNTLFHRVIKDFMIQGGDPLGNGSGGPGYQFEDEAHPELRHNRPGILSMANAGPNTNGSQFFITEVSTPWLDGKHTVFGAVVEGFDVIKQIAVTETATQDRPKEAIILEKIEIKIED
jgi:peptidyl-prolyl cis-trans isomerase A (cyclophilin A)